MKYGLSLDQPEESTWKPPNCLSTMQSLLGLPFSPQGAGITPWWVSLTLCLADDHVGQTKPTTAQIVFSVMHREGSGGFSEGLCVCGMHSEEKLIAIDSF